MIRTQIQLHAEQIQWLKTFALQNGISMSQAIRDSIDSYRVHTQRIHDMNAKKKKALEAVGTFSTEAKGREQRA